MKKYSIVLAGGGTGGHVFPIQSLLQHIDKNYYGQIQAIYRYGSKKGLEHTIFSQTTFHHIKPIFIHSISGKFRRETRILSILKNIRDAFLLIVGIFVALRFLHTNRPDKVFCKGGFVALPLIIAAKILKIPIVLHESDVKPGLTNRIAARFATTIFSAFPGTFPHAHEVGQILSDDIVPDRDYAPQDEELQKIYTHIDPKKTYLTVIGGSQGSQFLYKMIEEILSYNKKLAQKYTCIIIGGYIKDNRTNKLAEDKNIHWLGFLSQKDMAKVLDITDLSLTRGGTTSLAEQQLYGIHKIIVPIPWTHDQYDNAERYKKHHKDVIIDQKIPEHTETLDMILQQQSGYKKKPHKGQKFYSITKSKDSIAQELFS